MHNTYLPIGTTIFLGFFFVSDSKQYLSGSLFKAGAKGQITSSISFSSPAERSEKVQNS